MSSSSRSHWPQPAKCTSAAVALICVVFGWSGGSQLVRQSYAGAKDQAREPKEKRRLRREAASGEAASQEEGAS
jgi:hypothetical protein